MKRLFASIGIWVALSPLVSEALAVSMGSAQITAVRNAVEKVENNQGRPAVVSDQVTEGEMVRTRASSLAELTFSDKTITRMGANSQFSYSAQERLVKIDKGTVLMHTPPGNGGATISSGGVTGAISGTSFLLNANPAMCTKKPCQKQLRERTQETDPLKRYYCEDHPDAPQTPSTGGFAIVVLEGKNVTKVTGPNGMTVELQPGQMAVVGPAMEGAPRVFTVDLATIIRTSPLIQAFPNPLPSIGDIVQMAIQQQRPQFKDLDLAGKALSEDGDLLVGPSDPPTPFKPDFEMASNTDGSGQKLPFSDEDIDTASGGGGGTPFAGPAPAPPAPPISPNPPIPPPPNPNPPPQALTVTAQAVSRVYDGTRNASIVGAMLSGAISSGVNLANETAGLFASKNVSISQPVATAMTLTGPAAGDYTLTQPALTAAITPKDVGVFNAVAQSKVYDGTSFAVVAGGILLGEAPGTGSATDRRVYLGDNVTLDAGSSGQFASKNVGTWSVTTTMSLSGGDAGNYNLIQPALTATITARPITLAAEAKTKVYGDLDAALTYTTGGMGLVAGDNLTGALQRVVGETVGKYAINQNSLAVDPTVAGNYMVTYTGADYTITARPITIQADVKTKVYGDTDPGLTYQLTAGNLVGTDTLAGTLTRVAGENVGSYAIGQGTVDNGNYGITYVSDNLTITARPITIQADLKTKVYGDVDPGLTYQLTAGNLVGTDTLAGSLSRIAGEDVGAYTIQRGTVDNGNYGITYGSDTLTITPKNVMVFDATAQSRVYDGTRNAVVENAALKDEIFGTGTSADGRVFTGDDVTLGGATSGQFASKNVGTWSVTTTMNLSGGDAFNYNLIQPTLTAAITQKDLTLASASVVTKAYDATTAASLSGTSLQAAIAPGSGSSTDGKPYSGDVLSIGNNTSGTFERSLPGTGIPVTHAMALGGGDAGNYNLVIPQLTGEITGTATLNQDGAALNVSSASFLHIRDTTANRMQDGLSINSTGGKVLLENCTFDGWMQKRITPFVIPDFGYGLTTFEETANVAVTAPVLAIKMSPTTPTGSLFTPDGTMFLGDYIVRVQLDPNKVPMSGDEVGVNFLDHTAIGPDPFDFGSVANGADLILYDGATISVNTIDYNSIDVAAGEYQPDSPASGLNGPSAVGNWEVRASDNSIGGEGQVDEVKLKYGYSKAIIQGANGVELVDVQFQGMDEVEVKQDLNNRVLLSGTLASDPKISKMIVQAGQALQAHFDSDATVKNLTASGAAEILAGVRPKTGGGYEFIPGSPDRVLEMQTATLAGQLSLASHTVVFNNANITSGGVIQVRTRDGMVNMNYGSVVPGTTSFIGASGNNFHNTANGVSMSIANSGNISSAFTAGKLTDVGTPGAATVMNVGKVQ